jgi:hypothetical protein
MKFEIKAFEGEKLISDLPILPLRYCTSLAIHSPSTLVKPVGGSTTPRQELIERGKRFIKMSSTKHVYYAGPTFDREMVDGQVVIDDYQIFQVDKSRRPPVLGSWLNVTKMPSPDRESTACYQVCCQRDTVWSEQDIDTRREIDFIEPILPTSREQRPSVAIAERPVAEVRKAIEPSSFTDEEYLIMSNRVYGFVLRTRRWAELDLAYISEFKAKPNGVNPTKSAFDDLVLPAGHKDVILSLVAQHFRDEEHHDVDIFRGKGKGLIVLLHGAPGVGKTSTAEGVAEAFKKPLLAITCGRSTLTRRCC